MGKIYTSSAELVRAVVDAYRFDAYGQEATTKFSSDYLDGIQVNMTKADLLHAWARINLLAADIKVQRLDGEELIPEEYKMQTVSGDALTCLEQINNDHLSNGHVFARNENGNYMDLISGEFSKMELLGIV